MPIVTIVKRFLLKDADNKLTEYVPGRYDMTDEVADNWYVQAHTEGFVEPPPKVGTEQQAVLLASQAARLNEPVDAQGQKPGESPPHTKAEPEKPEISFAGRRPPRQQDPGMVNFIDPSTLGPGGKK